MTNGNSPITAWFRAPLIAGAVSLGAVALSWFIGTTVGSAQRIAVLENEAANTRQQLDRIERKLDRVIDMPKDQ